MLNKVEVLMHPVRMKISQALLRNKENGLTPLEMVKIIKDVPQATLYRHIQVLLDSEIIHVMKEKKVKSVSEKYYALNEEKLKLDQDEWNQASPQEKLDFVSFYQLSLMTQYQNYLEKIEDHSHDGATFSLVELKMNDGDFLNFQNELKEILTKYYLSTRNQDEKDTPVRTIAVTIIPDT